jgi:ribonuclease-3
VKDGTKESFVAESNERLEFLGDAVLASVVATILYKQYPDEGEGFLTRFRSRLVQRQTLNQLAQDIELYQVVRMRVSGNRETSVNGNALEAVLGAVYLDQGYRAAERVIIKLFARHVDLEKLSKTDNDQKSRLLEWCQKRKKQIKFNVEEEQSDGNARSFKAEVFVDGKLRGYGHGRSKKRAEQEASKHALRKLRRRPKRVKKESA